MSRRASRWFGWILHRLLPGAYGRDYLADIEEGVAGRSRVRAILWCIRQVVRPDTLRLALRLHRRARQSPRTRPRCGRVLGTLRDDVESATRSLWRSPAHTLLVTGTLALGIGATTAIFSAVESVILHPFPYEQSTRMYGFSRPVGRLMAPPTSEQLEVWKTQDDLFEFFLTLSMTRRTLTGRGAAERVLVGRTDAQTLAALGIRPRLGRTFAPEEAVGEGARVVVLADHVWRSRFGSDPDVLGRTVSLDGESWEVIGVMPPRTPFPHAFESNADLWAPLAGADAEAGDVVAVFRPGVTADEVQTRLDLIRDRAVERGESTDRWQAGVYSVTSRVGAAVAEPLRVLMTAVVLVLLIAFVNVANLLLGRSNLRRSETSVKSALGASRARLVRQLLIESVMLGGLGTALGLAVAFGAADAVRALRPADLVVLDQVRMGGRVLWFAIALGMAGSVVFGTLPAWRGTRARGLAGLKSGLALQGRDIAGRQARWVLVSGEVALSFALLAGAVMGLRALHRLQTRDLAFAADEIVFLTATLPSWEFSDPSLRAAAETRLSGLIERQRGVADVSVSRRPPLVGGVFSSVAPQVEGEEPIGVRELIQTNRVDEKLHRVLGVPILEGRTFSEGEVRDSAAVAVLPRRTARRLFGDESPLGRRFRYGEAGSWYTVVGVSGDMDPNDPDVDRAGYLVYRPGRGGGGSLVVRVEPGFEADAVRDRLVEVVRAEAPDALIPVASTGREVIRERTARERFTTTLLSTFGALAVVLAMVGLYGVVSSMVGQRTREIGIRVSVGADRSDVRRLVFGEGLGAAALGILAGSALAWTGLKLLASRIVGLDSTSVGALYAWAATLMAVATLAACWVPARRAVRIDPVRALREE